MNEPTPTSGKAPPGLTGPEVLRLWKWPVLAVALGWVLFVVLLRIRWSAGEEFYYGWAVVPLAGYLALERWADRPDPTARGGGARWLAVGFAVLGALAIGVAGVLLAPNPLWTMPAWLAGGGAAALTLGLAGAAGGRQWAMWFVASVLVALAGLPWPAAVQVPLVALLQRGTATIAAEWVSAFGHPAISSGSTIQVGEGVVGIDEACSGLRALQAVVMLALFFGELLRLTLPRRIALLFGGIGVALAANTLRAVFLTWQMAGGGAAQVAAWHDRAGTIELFTGLIGVALLAWRLGATAKRETRVAFVTVPTRAVERSAVVAIWLLGVGVIFTAWWYRPSAASGGGIWQLTRPAPEWTEYMLPANAATELRCASSEGWQVRQEAGRDWVALRLHWGGDPEVRYTPGNHSPEICLPAVGVQLERELGIVRAEVAGRTWVLRAIRFKSQGRAMHVFTGLWDGVRAEALTPAESVAADFDVERWLLVRERRRDLDLDQLTVAVVGCTTDDEAVSRLRALLPRLLIRKN